jgi:uncharacterized membrane protein
MKTRKLRAEHVVVGQIEKCYAATKPSKNACWAVVAATCAGTNKAD